MRIALLQVKARLGEIGHNIQRADKLLNNANLGALDLLVLPELAFTGYNFVDLESIQPFLEPTASGVTTRWAIKTAQRLSCTVIVGYPEVSSDIDGKGNHINYNSTVTVNRQGEVIGTYRKKHLWYVDESWSTEGKDFYHSSIAGLGSVAHGICMDINPREFTAPWEAYEFANHCVDKRADMVILSTAWLTHTPLEELQANPDRPDSATISYWLQRFSPLMAHLEDRKVFVVVANRCGFEVNKPRVLHLKNGRDVELNEPTANYAGSSCVLCFQNGKVSILDILGQYQEDVLVVDTDKVSS